MLLTEAAVVRNMHLAFPYLLIPLVDDAVRYHCFWQHVNDKFYKPQTMTVLKISWKEQ